MGLFVPQFQLKPQKTEKETIGDQHFTFPSEVLDHLAMILNSEGG